MITRSNEKPNITILEKKGRNKNKTTYSSILSNVNEKFKNINDNKENTFFDEFTALQIHYNENYRKKDLELILGYYKISKRKKNKMDIVNEISLYELDVNNFDIVNRRKLLWHYIDEIQQDSYMSKFLILD